MNIKDQCCSLELAKKLKNLGVRQESYFYWCLSKKEGNGGLPVFYQLADINRLEKSCFWPEDKISAFTSSELGDMLPCTINVMDGADFKIFQYIEWKITEKYLINYYSLFPEISNEIPSANIKVKYHLMENHIFESNEANARAKMLIFLIENKLIEVPNGKS
jgi:hypothetical protein